MTPTPPADVKVPGIFKRPGALDTDTSAGARAKDTPLAGGVEVEVGAALLLVPPTMETLLTGLAGGATGEGLTGLAGPRS